MKKNVYRISILGAMILAMCVCFHSTVSAQSPPQPFIFYPFYVPVSLPASGNSTLSTSQCTPPNYISNSTQTVDASDTLCPWAPGRMITYVFDSSQNVQRDLSCNSTLDKFIIGPNVYSRLVVQATRGIFQLKAVANRLWQIVGQDVPINVYIP
jgi:hypothetical protein